MDLEKSFKVYAPFDLYKSVDDEGEVYYHGVASSSSIDRDNEKMSEEVLRKASSQLPGQPVFFNHQHKQLGVGKITKAWHEDGLLKIQMKPTKAAGMQDVIMQIEEGILKAFSIGGKSLKTETAVDTNGHDYRVIKDADFYEVSVVGIPANPDAQILGRMAKLWKVDESEVEQEKREHPWATDEQARRIASDHEKKDGEVDKRDTTMETEKARDASAKKEEDKDEKKDEVKKENGPSTPNEPKLAEGLGPMLERAKADIDLALSHLKASESPVNTSHTAAPMPEKPAEKAAPSEDLVKALKENEELKKKIEDYEIKAAKTKSLVVDEKVSEAPLASVAKADGSSDFAKAFRRI